MREMITISSKGQVVIPKKLRKEAELEPGDQLLVEWDGSSLTFRKVEDGSAKPSAGLVRELLGKYQSDNEDEDENNVRTWRETLYGKVDD
ncbi:MAG TPA: AbrB/MazE/SpoVT family DNA-binding domain-containing protein [Bacillales bacterium]